MHVTGARCPQDVLVPPRARRWLYHSLRMEWSPKWFLLRYVPVFGICLRLPPITWAVLLGLLEPFPAFISLLSDDTPLLSSRLGDSVTHKILFCSVVVSAGVFFPVRFGSFYSVHP